MYMCILQCDIPLNAAFQPGIFVMFAIICTQQSMNGNQLLLGNSENQFKGTLISFFLELSRMF